MPRGGKRGHKGRAKQFTNPEEIEAQMKVEKEKDKEGAERASDSDSDAESSEDDSEHKKKGVEGLIEIENPNRVTQKNKKVNNLDLNSPQRELSRREREEIEKQQARERYMKLHLEGKTDQARADLARLAIIRKQREDAAKKRENEKKAKESKS
ncbi:pdgfa associated protein 1a [Callorhinchus milii]|uniref:Pdgfa associated protein 1a n=1 Tax=Callorhinchus milii TaxID=7868 RepID=A0A4W3HDC0_CALMI|nr:pdgfa associated protein 1a [Callorhinchus milii]|eukprot:gi/632987740/ref/XP_007882723.1/ PREDICTED: 28 kDa heat- and acid-stable phosphoprotein [Callorhinchus milii]